MIDVKLENISKTYDGKMWVLTDIDVSIAAGELFFLLGPSGCGKSTLLRIVAGFIRPDTGAVFFGDENVSHRAPERRNTAMVFQNYALWPHMTVSENVAFGLDVQGVASEEKRRRVAETLELVGLTKYASRKPPSLSGGQQQRVALARAVVVRPQVLLLDEPLSNLDAKLRTTMRGEIRRICKEAELTAIYVTHDQKEALTMADRIAVLHAGRLQQTGTPREIYRRPINRFVADFIGESNFIGGTVKEVFGDGVVVETPLGVLRSRCGGGRREGDAVHVLIRPESFAAAAADAENAIAATVTGGTFLGDLGEWQAVVNEVELTICELQPDPRAAGSRATFAVSPDDVVILAGD